MKKNCFYLVILSMIVTAVAIDAEDTAPCRVDQSALNAFSSPATVTHNEFTAAERSLYLVRCKTGPQGSSRDLFFRIVEKKFTVPYRSLRKRWAAQGIALSESDADAALMYDGELLDYLDEITTPQDTKYKSVILKFANGNAIAQMGRAVKPEVLAMATQWTPEKMYNSVRRNDQAEAVRALGYWIDPGDRTLTESEKREVSELLLGLLPAERPSIRSSPEMSSAEHRVTQAAVEALGRSGDALVAQSLLKWSDSLPSYSTFRHSAAIAGEKIYKRAVGQ